MKPVRFTRASRKHRVGRASARHIGTVAAGTTQDEETGADVLTWIGEDERSRELEIVALDRPDCILGIHVMPTHYRRNKS